MGKRLDLVGQRFGRLEVLAMVAAPNATRAECRCDCGAEVSVLAYNLRSGNTTSCGCVLRAARSKNGRKVGPRTGKLNATHGLSKTLTYARWQEAKKRCHSPANKRFKDYGARGIEVCDRWRESFENFLADMGECPEGLTLERKDGSRGYEPGNCVWATREQQSQNRPTFNKADPAKVREIRRRATAGEKFAALARAFGMSEGSVSNIVHRRTWKNVEE
jgi:hypothetical protein